jgi:hypothetical protein
VRLVTGIDRGPVARRRPGLVFISERSLRIFGGQDFNLCRDRIALRRGLFGTLRQAEIPP